MLLKNKNTIIVTSLVLVMAVVIFLLPDITYGQSVDLRSDFADFSTQDLKITIENIVRIILGFVGIIFTLILLYGGIVWMTSGGVPDKVNKAKKILISAVIGLIITLMSYAIATFIIRTYTGALNNGGAGGSGSGPGGFGFALGAGILESHYPARGAVGVPRNTNIFITFKEEINPNTICDTSGPVPWPLRITSIAIKDANGLVGPLPPDPLDPDGNDILDIVECSADAANKTFKLNPGGISPDHLGTSTGNTRYSVTLTQDIQTVSGDSAVGALGYQWTFTVSNLTDETPPYVVGVYPLHGSSDVFANTLAHVIFSEPVDPSTAAGIVESTTPTFDNIKLENAGALIEGTYISANGYRISEFIPNSLCGRNSCGFDVYCLPAPVPIVGTVTTNIKDMADNALDQDALTPGNQPFSPWDFTTITDLDLVAPIMTKRIPAQGDIDVGITSSVDVHFNEVMSASSIVSSNIGIDLTFTPPPAWVNFWSTSEQIATCVGGGTACTLIHVNHDTYKAITGYQAFSESTLKDAQQNCYYPTTCDVSGPGGVPDGTATYAPFPLGDDTDGDSILTAADCIPPF